MAPPTQPRRPRLIELDILRGLAILLVLGRHTPFYDAHQAGLLRPVASYWTRFGWTGVDLFFVLSGFLIGSLLFREIWSESRLNVGRFLIRRAFKIWPPYFVYLLFVLLLDAWAGRQGISGSARALWPNFMHLQNYLGTPREHTWSLAVEEHFYLLLPLLLLALLNLRLGRTQALALIPIIGGALIVLCNACRLWTNLHQASTHQPFSGFTSIYPTHLRVDALFFGVVLAYLHGAGSPVMSVAARHISKLLLAAGILVLPMLLLKQESGLFVPTVGLTMLYLGYGCLLLAMVYHASGPAWWRHALHSPPARVVALIGYYSYPIYLWHLDVASNPTHWLVEQRWTRSLPHELQWILGMTLYIALASGMGMLLGRGLEQPALKLRDRLFPSQVTILT